MILKTVPRFLLFQLQRRRTTVVVVLPKTILKVMIFLSFTTVVVRGSYKHQQQQQPRNFVFFQRSSGTAFLSTSSNNNIHQRSRTIPLSLLSLIHNQQKQQQKQQQHRTTSITTTPSTLVGLWSSKFQQQQQQNQQSYSFVTSALLVSKNNYIPPSDFTIVDDDNDDGDNTSNEINNNNNNYNKNKNNQDSNNDDDDVDDESSTIKKQELFTNNRKRSTVRVNEGASWMERNAKFTGSSIEETTTTGNYKTNNPRRRDNNDDDDRRTNNRSTNNRNIVERRNNNNRDDTTTSNNNNSKTFREDFRGTRVFVQGIPQHISWQTLKDHFRVAGNVVFASISTDPTTGSSKGHGIVQFETTEMAQNAIRIIRDYPIDGTPLFVREDVQERKGDYTDPSFTPKTTTTQPRGPTPPTKWKCANEDDTVSFLSTEEYRSVQQLLKARDQARRRKNYETSDTIREQLKYDYNVHIDDRLTMWWTDISGNKGPSMMYNDDDDNNFDNRLKTKGKVPQVIQDMKGDGRWGKLPPWRQIPTTPENDACVNPDLVMGLLQQRDIARREKDFTTADKLLEQARTAPDNNLVLRIHDESRTWRIWTPDKPPLNPIQQQQQQYRPASNRADNIPIADQCIGYVQEMAPHKVDEVRNLLEKFPGREYNILKKLKQRYQKQEE